MFVHTLQPQSSFPPTQNGLFKQSRSDKEDLMCSRSNGSVPTCLVLHRFTALSQADYYFRGQRRVCERGNAKKGKIRMPFKWCWPRIYGKQEWQTQKTRGCENTVTLRASLLINRAKFSCWMFSTGSAVRVAFIHVSEHAWIGVQPHSNWSYQACDTRADFPVARGITRCLEKQQRSHTNVKEESSLLHEKTTANLLPPTPTKAMQYSLH